MASPGAEQHASGGSGAPDHLDPSAGEEMMFGYITSLLRVHGAMTVHGEVCGGASLAWGARLDVQGVFRGAAHLSPGSVLRVQGSYDGTRVGRDGTVVVSGHCPLETARVPGTCVESGTVLVGQRRQCWTVGADGTLTPLGVSRHHAVDAQLPRRTMRWSERRERFVEV